MEHVRLDRDERWPDHFPAPDAPNGRDVELPDGFMRRWRRVSKAYNAIQNEMKEAWDAAG